ncbi:cell division protein FtsN [Pseudidiomarina sediminum]|uniref:Cell division protein FtsN n=1 Tax=Pseudidiomarina sediminum TaxID=431675 RepID=A0A432Z2X0_9GAMM|nr:SPOR domain-containing protein [Pseudidiomarina sediminum]RUO72238.1 cell division protein FtsN [Pseudidiomarina sediminum]
MDYANRKRPPQRKPAKGKRGSQKQTERQVPWGIVTLAVVLVIALVAGLRFIAGGNPDVVPPTSSESHLPTPTNNQVEAIPEKPEERWQYIEELENLEVEVDVPERELGPPKLMQCGSFRSKSDAERLRAAIALQGLEANVYRSNGGSWYRVVLGPYETKRAAEKDRHKLQRARIHGCQIWNWNL